MAKIWTLNGHKMAKNGPNDPIFGPVVYSNGFYQIPKKIEIARKSAIFRPENRHFRWFDVAIFDTQTSHKSCIGAHTSDPFGLIFGILAPQGI